MVSLAKSAEAFRVSLEKKGIVKMPDLEMAAVMDVSGSFVREHRQGLTTGFLSRIVPWGMTFDPDGKIDVFTFSNGPGHYVGVVEAENHDDYVQRSIVDRVPNWGGATDYAPVLRMVLDHFGWLKRSSGSKSASWLSRLFGGLIGGRGEVATNAPKRAIVFFLTDGANDDPVEAKKVVAEAERDGYEVFFVLVGMSLRETRFELLKSMAQAHQNVIFRRIEDVEAFNRLSDEALNEFFLDDKLTAWLSR